LLSEVVAAVVGLLLVAVLGRRHIRSRLPYLVRASSLAVLVFIVIGAYPIWMQFFGPQHISAGIVRPPVFVGDLRGLVVPIFGLLKASTYGYGPSHFTGEAAEWNSYLGVPLLLVAVATVVVFHRRRLVLWAGLFALTMTVLSFGPQLHIDG